MQQALREESRGDGFPGLHDLPRCQYSQPGTNRDVIGFWQKSATGFASRWKQAGPNAHMS